MPSYLKHLEHFKYLPTPYKKRSEEGKTHHCIEYANNYQLYTDIIE